MKPPPLARTGLLAVLLMALASLTLPAGAAQPDSVNSESPLSLSSPDGDIKVGFELKSGRPFYNVSHHGKPFLLDSSLGLQFKDAPALDDDFEVRSVHREEHDSTWRPQWGEYDKIKDRYNELTVDLQEKSSPGRRLQLVFRVFDDGVGFRYVLPRQDAMDEFAMTEEDTRFRFAADFTSHWIPAEYGPGIGDEHHYRTTPISQVEAANTPLTIETPDRGYATLHEANLIDYASMTAARASGDGDSATPTLRSALVPMPDGVKVRGTAPHKSPWRTLVIADTAAELMESTLVLNLNDPCRICEKDTSWIKPGKYVGVWWELHKGVSTWEEGPEHGASTENAKRYIDFAAKHKIPYVMAEGWDKNWQGPPSSYLPSDSAADFDMKEVVRYTESKGVKWMVHNETFGDISNYDRQIDEVYAEYERLGVPAIKTGYVSGTKIDGQEHPHYDQVMVNKYREHIKKAAEHHLMVEAHEIVKDTGERRTYPNFMTREAVKGQEWEAWSEGNPPEHTVDIPFTRMMAGPVSYTPGVFATKWDPAGPGKPSWRTIENARAHTTRAKQLAMYPVYLSGLQMLADLPQHYEGEPELAFLEQVPTTWDDTEAVNGKIGDYVTVARKSGRAWYVGSMTDENERSLPVPLRFLDQDTWYTATIYGDAPATDLENNPDEVEIKRVLVKSTDSLVARMAAGGGQAVKIAPASRKELGTLPKCGQATPFCQP